MKKSFKFIVNMTFVLLFSGILFSYAMFQGGFVSWFLFYSFLPIFLYQTGFLLYSLSNWKVERVFSSQVAEAGESVLVNLQINRSFPFPIYYCLIEEVIPDSLKRKDTRSHKYVFMDQPEKFTRNRRIKEILFLGMKRKMEISYDLDELPRGHHELSEVRIVISDVFGFIKKEETIRILDQLNVYPHERELQLIEGESFGQGSHAINAFHYEQTNAVNGIREYVPGDRISRIHWKQSAKNNALMTKEFEQVRSTSVMLVLDATKIEENNPLVFEAMVELTLSFISNLERLKFHVNLLAFGKETNHFSLKQDAFMKKQLRNYLINVQPEGELPFSIILRENMSLFGKSDMSVVLTGRVDDFFRQTMHELKQRNHVVVYYIQASRSISKREVNTISRMKNEGIPIQVLTEKELAMTPLEVSIK